MLRTYYCDKGCCPIKVKIYSPHGKLQPKARNCKKAGVFIYDPKKDKILLVQSRGQLWGPPKGTIELERKETIVDCAIREVKEESGLDVDVSEFQQVIQIKNRATYFYMERDTCDVKVQDHVLENDANGITWIKLSCLEDIIKSGKIILNQHCKIGFKKFMQKTFPKSDFIKVNYSRRRRKKL